jgi:cysteine desulfurase
MKTIYLDNNATTMMLPQVAETMGRAMLEGYANPASQHSEGRKARKALENAKEQIGKMLGAEMSRFAADRLLLTSGGTEANHLAVRGIAQAFSKERLAGRKGRAIVSAIEHPSVMGAAEQLKEEGWSVAMLPVDAAGVVRADLLPELLTPDTAVVSVMLANNETGVLQPVAELAEICRHAGVPLHTDATQGVGKLPVHFGELGVDALTCTAHKFHGPRGIGALVLRNGVKLEPLWQGGFQQAGLRSGTEDVVLAIGMSSALEFFWTQLAKHSEGTPDLHSMRADLEGRLLAGWPEAAIHGSSVARLPHTTCISFPPLDRQALVMALDLAGICCSTGSACASGSSEPSPVLLAMGLPEEQVRSAIRFSLGNTNTRPEAAEAAQRILKVCNDLRRAGDVDRRA